MVIWIVGGGGARLMAGGDWWTEMAEMGSGLASTLPTLSADPIFYYNFFFFFIFVHFVMLKILSCNLEFLLTVGGCCCNL